MFASINKLVNFLPFVELTVGDTFCDRVDIFMGGFNKTSVLRFAALLFVNVSGSEVCIAYN